MSRIPLLLAAASLIAAAEPTITIDLALKAGSGDKPMVVAWVERTDGTFVRTLHMFSRDRKYFKDMTTWSAARAGQETDAAVDAVSGATVSWASHQKITVPATGLLGGDMVLRIEQRKDKGGHYKKDKYPIAADWRGVLISDRGYIASATVSVGR